MDSPDDPFLDSGAGSDVDEQDSPNFQPRTPPADRPTLTNVLYVVIIDHTGMA